MSRIDDRTTDLGEAVWREPVERYHSQERLDAEIALLRRLPIPFCLSPALPELGSYAPEPDREQRSWSLAAPMEGASVHQRMPASWNAGRELTGEANLEAAQRGLDGVVTAVYHLFPNAFVSVLSKQESPFILELLSPTRTKWVIH